MLGKGCRSARACAADMTAATDSARTRALMRQHKASERKAAQRWSFRTQKARTAPPCSPAAGRNRALRHEFGKDRLLHKQSAFLRRAPPSANIACAERPFTCCPRSGRKFSTDGQKVHSKLKEEAEKGKGKTRKEEKKGNEADEGDIEET